MSSVSRNLSSALRRWPMLASPFGAQHARALSNVRAIKLSSLRQQERFASRRISECSIHTSRRHLQASRPPSNTDRGPISEEDTQTDFGSLNVLGNSPTPTTAIDACHHDGFLLNSGQRISGGSGCLLVGGEAFSWRPWEGRGGKLVNKKGQWECANEAWGVLDLVWPRPDLLVLGLGSTMRPISPDTRNYINSLGIRIEIQDTRNAAAQYNLLATERGIGNVAAALVHLGWKDRP